MFFLSFFVYNEIVFLYRLNKKRGSHEKKVSGNFPFSCVDTFSLRHTAYCGTCHANRDRNTGGDCNRSST
jgi:hypothetical protein